LIDRINRLSLLDDGTPGVPRNHPVDGRFSL